MKQLTTTVIRSFNFMFNFMLFTVIFSFNLPFNFALWDLLTGAILVKFIPDLTSTTSLFICNKFSYEVLLLIFHKT